MADGLTLKDLEEIKADAAKAVTRQFRDAAEDHGWTPTPTPAFGDVLNESSVPTEDDMAHVMGSSGDGLGFQELRNAAKDLGLPAGGSKEELQARIDEATKSTNEESN